MNPQTEAITFSRTLPPAAFLNAYQGAPLRLTGTLESGESLSWATNLVAEIRGSQADTESPLASESVSVGAGTGPYTFDFTGPEMALSIRSGTTSRRFYLQITARDSVSGRTEVLAVRQIILHRSAYSGLAAASPSDLYALQADLTAALARIAELESDAPTLTDSGAGYATLTVGAVTVKVPTVTVGA